MKKLRWMMLSLLALPLVTNIKASDARIKNLKKEAVVTSAKPSEASVTLIEQILFPHGS